jgi:hypothetical protein
MVGMGLDGLDVMRDAVGCFFVLRAVEISVSRSLSFWAIIQVAS